MGAEAFDAEYAVGRTLDPAQVPAALSRKRGTGRAGAGASLLAEVAGQIPPPQLEANEVALLLRLRVYGKYARELAGSTR